MSNFTTLSAAETIAAAFAAVRARGILVPPAGPSARDHQFTVMTDAAFGRGHRSRKIPL